MQEHIITFTKIHFYPMKPKQEDVRIEDIAHALSLMTRANGHFKEFYSVAQHSLDCTAMAKEENRSPKESLACLLHDASEAYLSDITRPVKAGLTEYKQIEQRLQRTIYEKFIPGGLTEKEEKLVKRYDDACLYYEFEHFMGERLFEEPPREIKKPEYRIRAFQEVEDEFKEVFRKLTEELR